VRRHVAARAWSTTEGPRALYDRAVVHMLKERVLLPGITVLTRLVGEARRQENLRLFGLLAERTPAETAVALQGLLQVPEDRRVSELERLRTSPTKASGRVLVRELDRVAEIGGIGAGRVEVEPVPAVKLASLARYGMASKAPTLRELEAARQTATLLATVRHLETASTDDALDVLDLLISSNLLAKAERAGKAEQMRTLPQPAQRRPQHRLGDGDRDERAASDRGPAGVAGGGVERDRTGGAAGEADGGRRRGDGTQRAQVATGVLRPGI
jgi:hypothetical protein